MSELWLNFTDKDGYPERILVERDFFTIGRQPDNNLSYADNRLSRQHLKIERINDKFIVTDCNSSNGTRLNEDELFEPETLRDGDILNLGGGLEIRVEIISKSDEENFYAPPNEISAPHTEINRPQTNKQNDQITIGGISGNFFFIAPALGLLILLLIGGVFLIIGGNSETNGEKEIAETSETKTEKTPKENLRTPSNTPTPSPTPANAPENSSATQTPSTNSGGTMPKPVISNEIEGIKAKAAEFMKQIARNDESPFLRTEEAEKVNQKIKNFRNSAALAENFRAVLRDKSQYESLANSQALKPQFLAAAALNEIGNRSGNPLETAKQMLPVLGKLKISLDNNFADDNILIIAAYKQGKNGNINAMQNKLAGFSKELSNKGESVTNREMRKIWFLKQRGKLSDAEFEYAVNFLAIGVIMQNPKDFGVNAEAVVF